MMTVRHTARPLGLAIIGAGYIAQRHALAAAKIPSARVISVYDKALPRAQALADQLGAVATENLQSAIEIPGVEAAIVCTPSGAHMEPAVTCLTARRHVLVEKPIEITLDRANTMIAAADRSGCKLAVVFQRRLHPAVQYLYQAVKSGKLGQITMIEGACKCYRSPAYFRAASWRGTWAFDGGGAIMNQGIHFLDLIQWIGGPVESIQGRVARLFQPIETEDTAAAILRFRSGALGVFQVTTGAFPHVTDRLEVTGTQGSMAIERGCVTFKYFGEEDGTVEEAYGLEDSRRGRELANAMQWPEQDLHQKVIEDFVVAIREGRDPVTTGESARESVALAQMLYSGACVQEEVSL